MKRATLILAVMALLFGRVWQASAEIVPGNSNIYGAGHPSAPAPGGGGGGSLPPLIAISGDGYLTFQVSGQVSYNGGGNYYGADGLPGASTNIYAYGGIAGTQITSAEFPLVGVFVNNQDPSVGEAPPDLVFTNTSFATVSAGLNQVFFIGDGLTGTGTGSQQTFYVPEGATRLFLGFADGSNFTGLPGTYNDDIGSLNVNFAQTASVPEPSSIMLTLAAIGAGYAGWRRSRRKSLASAKV